MLLLFGGVAQLARACGSYSQCRGFDSLHRYHPQCEEVRKRVSELNSQNAIKRKESSKIAATANRVVEIQSIKSAYLPQDLVKEFTEILIKKNFGSEAHQKRILSHWKYQIIREMLIANAYGMKSVDSEEIINLAIKTFKATLPVDRLAC